MHIKVSVEEVLTGDTFRVSPEWLWDFNEGDTVKAKGYDAPRKGHPLFGKALKKSQQLLLGKEIEIKNPADLTEHGQLVCDVYVAGKNVAEYFSEYRNR
jgi:endonuclease YncB( thermonuclease family)